MTLAWVAGALIILAACFVHGLAGFGIGLVALAFLPYLMPPATAVVLITLYAALLIAVIFVPLRRDLEPRRLPALVLGTLAGAPLGVWVLATLPAGTLRRLIGLVLVAVVALEWLGVRPGRMQGRGWALGAGLLAGMLGGAVGTPAPPVVLYAASQDWGPRTIKANLQAFLAVNQVLILAGYWWAGLLTAEVLRLAALFALPAAVGVAAGMRCFTRVDPARFRRMVFALLFASGLALLARG